MARAPTRLKQLFYQSESIDDIFDVLAKSDVLSPTGRRNRKTITQLIRKCLARGNDDGPPMPGPAPADRIESALIESGYLNARGREWADTIVNPLDTGH